MEIEQFLNELDNIDFESIDREQQERFRTILLDNGLFDKALKLSEVIYNQNKEDDAAIESYVHNLMYLDKKDEALVVLYNSPKTPAILYLEGLIYKEDELFEIAEEKFVRARELTDVKEAVRAIDKELVAIYLETGREEKAKDMFSKVNLPDSEIIMKSYPHQLSGGMKQRVGIAMALTFHPKIILADEPTSALDVITQAQIVKEIMELRKVFDTSIIMVTHNLGVAAYISDKIIVMQNGKIVDAGDKNAIINNSKSEYTKKLLAAVPEIGGERLV